MTFDKLAFQFRPALLLLALAVSVLGCRTLSEGTQLFDDNAAPDTPVVLSSPEMTEVSEWLFELQKRLKNQFQISDIYIGGGSARAVLDHVYFNEPLVMRDLDIFAIANRQVTKEFAMKIGRDLNIPEIGAFAESELRPRPRGNPKLPFPESHKYNAGFGFFWLKDQKILDLSVYHSTSDLALNGIFDYDMAMIKLSSRENLDQFVQTKLRGKKWTDLAKNGLILDVHEGYKSWRQRSPKIINWIELESKPMNVIVRVARGYGKLGVFDSDPKTTQRIREILGGKIELNNLQTMRNLEKLMGDKEPAKELKFLEKVGFFQAWNPQLHQALSRLSVEQLQSVLDGRLAANPKTGPPAVGTENIHKVMTLIALLEPTRKNADWRVEQLLTYLTRNNAAAKEANLAQLLRKSSFRSGALRLVDNFLSSEKRMKEKALTLIAKEVPDTQRKEVLTAVSPSIDELSIKRIRNAADRKGGERVGYFTGVFNPVHLGHIESMKAAIKEMKLNRLIIVPTPATTHNEVPIAWEHRRNMLALAVADIPGAEVISVDYLKVLEEGTGVALDKLKAREGNSRTTWVQVMGADSFERFVERGFAQNLKATPRQNVFVLAREGYDMPKVPVGLEAQVKVYDPSSQRSGETNFSEERRASSEVRRRLAVGEQISTLVPPKVELYIRDNALFAPPCKELGHMARSG